MNNTKSNAVSLRSLKLTKNTLRALDTGRLDRIMGGTMLMGTTLTGTCTCRE